MGTPLVAILLATLNGERFLAEQLDSYAGQTHTNWKLWASDDGSSDGTVDILRSYQSKWGEDRLAIRSGPQQGFAKNFMALASSKEIEAEYYAFSDQDDIWLPEKIHRAVRWLSSVPSSIPAMYCSRTELVDQFGNHIGHSPLFQRPASFKNALVQNIAGGNTIIFNRATKSLLNRIKQFSDIVSHDWLLYIFVAGVGGHVHYDPLGQIMYRQHDKNLVGANSSPYAKIQRGVRLVRGDFKAWLDSNAQLLHENSHLLTAHNRALLRDFYGIRGKPLHVRLKELARLNIYRQTRAGSLSLSMASLLNKL